MEERSMEYVYKNIGALEERSKILAILLDSKYLDDFREKLSKYLQSVEDQKKHG